MKQRLQGMVVGVVAMVIIFYLNTKINVDSSKTLAKSRRMCIMAFA